MGQIMREKLTGPNWGMIGIILTGIGFWTNVWFNGLFSSIMWLVIWTSIVIIILKLKGEI
tara:strand:- start:327 stop:506 length:180 start_codon:yes stop_codon:yes gene_type:complete